MSNEGLSFDVAAPDGISETREAGSLKGHYIASPIKARAGWILLVVGLFLMIVGGNTHFCEGFANRIPGKPNEVEQHTVTPMWPPTISSMSADITTPAGRFFFVFMLLGGGFVAQSNALPLSFWDHVSPGATYIFSMFLCLGTILVGTCPTDIMQRSTGNAPHIQKAKVSGYVHVLGAACAFILLPVAELYVLFKGRCQPTEEISRRTHIILQAIVAVSGLSFFLAFQLYNKWASDAYHDEYITNGTCGGSTGNDCRDYLGWLNLVGFWLEYSCASCAIALLGIRIFSFSPEGVVRYSDARSLIIQLDDPVDTTLWRPGVTTALLWQLVMGLASIGFMMWHWEKQDDLCCACAMDGAQCSAIYQNFNNGTQLCTKHVLS